MRPLWLGSAVLQAAELLLRPRGKAAGPAQAAASERWGHLPIPSPMGSPRASGPQNLGSPRMLGSPDKEQLHRPLTLSIQLQDHLRRSHSERAWPLQVHPPQDTKASKPPAQHAVWTCFPWLPAAPSVQQDGARDTHKPGKPRRPATLEQGADTHATAPSTNLQPQQTPAGQPPRQPLLPDLQAHTSGRFAQVQPVRPAVWRAQRLSWAWGWSPQEPGRGVRARRGLPGGLHWGFLGPAGAPAGGRSRCAPGPGGPCPAPSSGWRAAGEGAAPGRWRDPGPHSLHPARSLFPLNLPWGRALSWASSPGLTSSH